MLKNILKKIKVNKRAFTLVEILLAIALLSIAAISIGSIIINSQNNTSQIFTEAELQQQLSEARDSIQNEILSTNGGIKFWFRRPNEEKWNIAQSIPDDLPYEKLYAFYNFDRIDSELSCKYYLYNPHCIVQKRITHCVCRKNVL